VSLCENRGFASSVVSGDVATGGSTSATCPHTANIPALIANPVGFVHSKSSTLSAVVKLYSRRFFNLRKFIVLQALQTCKSITLPESFQKVPEAHLRKAVALCKEDGRWAQVAACMRCVHRRSPGTVRLPDCSVPRGGSENSARLEASFEGKTETRVQGGTSVIMEPTQPESSESTASTRKHTDAKADTHAAEVSTQTDLGADHAGECGDGQRHDRFVAFSHEGGCVRWAAVRQTMREAVQDRKGLLAARRAGRLKQT
jgi:hypothetical protein